MDETNKNLKEDENDGESIKKMHGIVHSTLIEHTEVGIDKYVASKPFLKIVS